MTEESRQKALHSYKLLIEYCFLKNYFNNAKNLSDNILAKDAHANLERYKEILEILKTSLQTSKERDDVRGAKIIDDYYDAVTPAKEDKIVIYFNKIVENEIKEIDSFIATKWDKLVRYILA